MTEKRIADLEKRVAELNTDIEGLEDRYEEALAELRKTVDGLADSHTHLIVSVISLADGRDVQESLAAVLMAISHKSGGRCPRTGEYQASCGHVRKRFHALDRFTECTICEKDVSWKLAAY